MYKGPVVGTCLVWLRGNKKLSSLCAVTIAEKVVEAGLES